MKKFRYDPAPSDEFDELVFSGSNKRVKKKKSNLRCSLIIGFGLVIVIGIILLKYQGIKELLKQITKFITRQKFITFKRQYTDQMIKAFGIKDRNVPDLTIFNRSYQEYGLNQDIQIGSIYDYLHLNETQQYKNFQINYSMYFNHQAYNYHYQSSLQYKTDVISYSYFSSQSRLKDYLYGMYQWNGQAVEPDFMLHIFLATHFIWNFSQPKVRAVQYYFYDKKYSITEVEKELQVCVFMSGHNIFSKSAYGSFFQSVEKQNYTNYKVILVDDNSDDDSAKQLYSYLSTKEYRLKNRIVIYRNLRRIGVLGNLYYYTRKFCDKNSIIVPVDPDEAFIGSQIFNVLNRLYHNHQNWCVYSNHIYMKSPRDDPKKGISRNFTFCMDEYRNFFDFWFLGHLTFRYQFIDSIPMEAFIQYHYQQNIGYYMPRFYESGEETFLFLSFMEMGGNSKVLYLDDFLYWYSGNEVQKCEGLYKKLNQRKSRVKRTFKIKNNVNQSYSYVDQNYDYKTDKNLEFLFHAYHKYKEECTSHKL